MTPARRKGLYWGAFALALLATALAYWPGLHGGFLLDDFPSIVQNPAMKLTHLSPHSILVAASSMNYGPFHRPLSMISFALEVWVWGMHPGPMKVTNLLIHLANGVLVLVLMRLLLAEYRRRRPEVSRAACDWAALAVTTAWLLAPINLTSVLYVVQRMTSLAAAFMLAGLICYVAGRRRVFHGHGVKLGLALMLATALLFTPIALAAKELGVLTVLYALVIEWVFFGFRNADGSWSRLTAVYFLAVVAVPAVLGLVWILPKYLPAAAWATRSFNLGERLLTEGRVLWHYVYWTLVPNLAALTLYHDAFPVSRSLFSPWTTLPACLGVGALLGAGLALRRRFPLISFGILWFLAGQVLTATIVPLELVFEHRMYLPSLGLFAVLLLPLLLAAPRERLRAARIAAAGALILLYAGGLALRASAWGNPLVQATIAAHEHPDSPRATYAYGRILASLTAHDPLLAPKAFAALDKAAQVPGQAVTPESALIILAHQTKTPVQAGWYRDMVRKLAARPPGPQDVSALYALVSCAEKPENPCRLNPTAMNAVFAAALSHRPANTQISGLYGDFLLSVAGRPRQAKQVFRALATAYPRQVLYHYNLAVAEVALGEYASARQELRVIRRLNPLGLHDSQVRNLTRLIDEATHHKKSSGH